MVPQVPSATPSAQHHQIEIISCQPLVLAQQCVAAQGCCCNHWRVITLGCSTARFGCNTPRHLAVIQSPSGQLWFQAVLVTGSYSYMQFQLQAVTVTGS